MQIDNAAIVLRPRGHWEAMDMGILFVRKHFLSLWLLWCATAAPVFILINFVLHNHPEFATLAFWWCKPLYEVILVAWLGQALFNNPPSVPQQLKQIPVIFKQGVISQITWRRLSLSRSFNMPVAILEQSHGAAYNNRLTTLQSTRPHSGWLTVLLFHIETAFYFAIPVLMLMLTPGEVELDLEQILLYETGDYVFLEYLVEFLGASLIAPFYVSAGFLLYINARTLLEAWDIEIAFKQMATPEKHLNRTTRVMSVALAIAVSLSYLVPSESQAVSREQAKQTITQVLAHDDFGKRETVTTWEPIIDNDVDNKEFDWSWLNNLEWLGWLFKILALVAIASMVIWLILKIKDHFDPTIFRKQSNKQNNTAQLPDFLLIDDHHEIPPNNPIDAVTILCQQGRYREALSLLYRASLMRCIQYYHLEIPASATESECLQIIKQGNNPELNRYFSVLTQNWQWLAWANKTPSESTIQQLCATWHDHFAKSSHGI